MANDQNTYAGTSNGADVFATLGNSVLEAFASISNVGVSVAGQAGSVLDSLGTLKAKYNQIFNGNQTSAPQETTPDWQVSSWSDFISDPARVQKVLVYGAIFSAVAFGTIYLVKKL